MTFIATSDHDGTPYDRCPVGLRRNDNLIAGSVSPLHAARFRKMKSDGRLRVATLILFE